MITLEYIFWICLSIVVYTYVGYGWILYLMVKIKELFNKNKKEFTLPKEELLPEVTLLVAAYNEEDIIHEKMANSIALDYPKNKLKLIWVTDGSTDKTNELLNKYKEVELLFVPERGGKTSALNRAIGYVTSPIVVFTDANTMINVNSIREMVRTFMDTKVGCVAGEKRIAIKEKDNAAGGGEGLYWKYESKLKNLDSRLYSTMGAAGELFAVRRELFEIMEQDTLLDDFVLSMNIVAKGYKIAYCPDAYAIESGSADMNEEQKRKIRIAAGGLQSIWRLRHLLNPFKYGIVTFQYISHRVLRWSLTPISLFALLPLNIALAIYNDGNLSLLYLFIMLLQVLFYLSGFWGYMLSKKKIKNKWLYVPYYFLFMNVNVVRGFFYLKKRKGNGAWEKAKRAS